MRRGAGKLVPLELTICQAASDLRRGGTLEFHGYLIAKLLKQVADARLLTAYGTLYRALSRLEKMGLLESRWEDPHIAARESRPGRRLYCLTSAADAVLTDARSNSTVSLARKKRLVPA
jgi:DNA-binding PadR family transcriptional regulator